MPRLIPFGDRVLVKRKTVGEKAGNIYLPENVQERATDLAVVQFIPEMSFADKQLLDSSERIIPSLVKEAVKGHSDALIALLRLNEFCKLKEIKVGDIVMISKYVGTDFHETGSNEDLTLVKLEDIIGVVAR